MDFGTFCPITLVLGHTLGSKEIVSPSIATEGSTLCCTRICALWCTRPLVNWKTVRLLQMERIASIETAGISNAVQKPRLLHIMKAKNYYIKGEMVERERERGEVR